MILVTVGWMLYAVMVPFFNVCFEELDSTKVELFSFSSGSDPVYPEFTIYKYPPVYCGELCSIFISPKFNFLVSLPILFSLFLFPLPQWPVQNGTIICMVRYSALLSPPHPQPKCIRVAAADGPEPVSPDGPSLVLTLSTFQFLIYSALSTQQLTACVMWLVWTTWVGSECDYIRFRLLLQVLHLVIVIELYWPNPCCWLKEE